MATFKEYQAAAQMRDIIQTIVREEMEATRPVYTYATVASIDRTARRCTVVFPDSADPVPVQMGAMQPQSVGQVVRIDGIAGDRYISEVLGSGHLEAADIVASSLKTTGTGRIEVDTVNGAVVWYRDDIPVSMVYGATGGGMVMTATTSSGSGEPPYVNLDNGSIGLIGDIDAAVSAQNGTVSITGDDDAAFVAENGTAYLEGQNGMSISAVSGQVDIHGSGAVFLTSFGDNVQIDADQTVFVTSGNAISLNASQDIQIISGDDMLIRSNGGTMWVECPGGTMYLDAGAVEIAQTGSGLVIKSLSGQRWLVGVDDSGNVQTVAL